MTVRGWKQASAAALAVAMAGCSSSSGGSSGSTSGSGSSTPAGSASPAASASPLATATGQSAAAWQPPTVVAPPAGAKPVPGSDARADGVVRVQVNNCVGLAQATGFFVAKDLVLTAANVFPDASTISVHSDAGVVRGQLVGLDKAKGVALVKVLPTGDGGSLSGHVFSLAGADPTKGAPVTMLAHPLGLPLYQSAGTVVGTVAGTIEHTANAAPGTSGGLLLDASGKAAGLEVATNANGSGTHHAVSLAAVSALVAGWENKPQPRTFKKCVELGPPSMTSIHPDAPAIKAALTRYLWGISNPTAKDEGGTTGLQVAWQKLGPAQQRRYQTPEKFLASLKGAKPDAANVDNLELRDHFTDTLLWTVQMSGPGKSCAVHNQRLVLSTKPGHWVIDQAADTAAPVSC